MKAATLYSISEIERETGISRDTLRVWERRYNFPTPTRDQRSERLYSIDQLNRLRLIKQLLDDGMRPGKLVPLDEQQLRQLTGKPDDTRPCPTDIAALLDTLTNGPRHALRAQLETLQEQYGLRGFITEVVATMNQAVGEAWFAGKIGIFDEHYYAEQVRKLLTAALVNLPSGNEKQRVLLTTLPGELHGLGLLMVACLLGLEGADVLLIGVQTPLDEIVRGAVACECSVVGISCSAYMRRRAITSQLVKLRKLMPKNVTIWAGGDGVRSLTIQQDGIRVFTGLNQLQDAIRALQVDVPAESVDLRQLLV